MCTTWEDLLSFVTSAFRLMSYNLQVPTYFRSDTENSTTQLSLAFWLQLLLVLQIATEFTFQITRKSSTVEFMISNIRGGKLATICIKIKCRQFLLKRDCCHDNGAFIDLEFRLQTDHCRALRDQMTTFISIVL